MSSSLSHVILFVSDMSKAVAFYRDTVGLQLKFSSPEWSEFVTGGTTLALHPAREPGQAGRAEPGLAVDDIQGFHRALTADGVVFTMPPVQQEHGWLARFVDADGVSWSVSQM